MKQKLIQNRIKFFNAYLKQCNIKDEFFKNFKKRSSINWRRKHKITTSTDKFFNNHFEDWEQFLSLFVEAFPWEETSQGAMFWGEVNGNWWNKCRFECDKYKLII